jgi:NTP pyrophosphatase (non-canonical NTP hydrolase)
MKEITQEVLEFLKERGWDNLRPSDLAKSISIEAAEILEIFQWSSKTIEETQADPEKMEKLKKELADVTIYVLQMCALLGIDAEEAVRAKLQKTREKYPAELFKNLDRNSQGEDTIYWKIKSEYRRKEA